MFQKNPTAINIPKSNKISLVQYDAEQSAFTRIRRLMNVKAIDINIDIKTMLRLVDSVCTQGTIKKVYFQI